MFTKFPLILNRITYNFIHYQTYLNQLIASELQNEKKHYLIVGFNLSDEDREVLDTQCGVIVDFLVGPLYCGLWVSTRKMEKSCF